jgi:transmembrane sensor
MDAEHPMDEALDQAAEWQIRLMEEPQAREEFERWLAADGAHRIAWQRMQLVWGALDEVMPPAPTARDLPVPVAPVPVASRPRRASRSSWQKVALACGVAALAIMLGPQTSLYLQSDYRTGTAETTSVTLTDGSRVTLGPDSAIRVEQGTTRRVELLKGQAYFQVAPDAGKPFIAQAGELAVRVLGTAFDLEMDRNGTEVALEHGQVQAESGSERGSERSALQVSERLLPGDRIRVDWQAGTVQRARIDPRRVAAWREQTLYVEDLSVGDIVARLERYMPGWIVIADNRLKDRRISGVFDLRDPDRALLALAQSLNVPSRRITSALSVLGEY